MDNLSLKSLTFIVSVAKHKQDQIRIAKTAFISKKN